MRAASRRLIAAACGALLPSACLGAGAAPTAPAPAPTALVAHGASAPASAASASAAAPASAPPVASAAAVPRSTLPPIAVEVLLTEQRDRASDPTSWQLYPIAEGLLLVSNLPARATLIQGRSVRPLPDLFRGVRSPDPGSPRDYFSVSAVRGKLASLEFDVDAPSTGKSGHVKAGQQTGARPPTSVSPRLILPPVTTRRGALLYQEALTDEARASEGFRFAFDGPARGEPLPRAAPGAGGCRFQMLGHPVWLAMGDGSTLGLGGLCESGDDPLALAQLDPFLTPSARMPFHARPAVERFTAAGSAVEALPGAGRLGILRNGELLAVDDRQALALVVTEFPPAAGSTTPSERPTVALFDGQRWSDVTPPGFTYGARLFRPGAGAPLLLSPSRVVRWSAGGWQPVALPDCLASADPEGTLQPVAAGPDGAVVMAGGNGCLGRLEPGAAQVQVVAMPSGFAVQQIAHRDGETYVVIEKHYVHQVVRLAR